MSNITRNIPDGSTQAQIDAIVNEMILECATAIAQSRAIPCSTPVPNDMVFFLHVCDSGTFTFTGTLPTWITVDAPDSQLVGEAGTFFAATKDAANLLAQTAINDFGNAALVSGDLSCVTPTFTTLIIQGYFDGMIANS